MAVQPAAGRFGVWPAKLGKRLRSVRDDEGGAAILIVVAVITVGLAVAGVAIVTATNVLSGGLRDERSKAAFAAAEAGAQVALFRQNQVNVTNLFPCVGLNPIAGDLQAQALAGGDWCPEISGAEGEATYAYRVRRPALTDLLSRVEVVSTGTASGVTRRIHVVYESPRAEAVFAESTVQSDQDLTLSGNAAVVANSATNSNIVLNQNAVLCGVAQYGEGMGLLPDGASTGGGNGNVTCDQADYPETTGTLTLLDIDQGDVADPANNDNDRIDPTNPLAPDTISGQGAGVQWDPQSRVLALNSNSALTLGGSNYSFCKLEMHSNTKLIVAANASVRIFFDAPENCPGVTGPQIQLDSNSKLTTTSGNPGDLQLLVVGSSDPANTTDNVVLSSNSSSVMPIILYAPHSDIELNSNTTLLGGVAGESVHLDSNATVFFSGAASSLQIPLPLHYRQAQFVECSSTRAPADAPSSNC